MDCPPPPTVEQIYQSQRGGVVYQIGHAMFFDRMGVAPSGFVLYPDGIWRVPPPSCQPADVAPAPRPPAPEKKGG